VEDFGFLAILIVVFLIVAPILGVIGFARTKRLMREVEELRATSITRFEFEALHRSLRPTLETPATAPIQQEVEPSPEPPPVPPPESVRQEIPPPVVRQELTLKYTSLQTPAIDIESVIGGKWLNIIGLVAVLLATAFFLKYAFDNNWIGPIGRVALGLLAGTALIVASQALLIRGWTYFSEGMTGLGAGILYLSLFAAWSYYSLIPTEAAFAGMAAVTISLIVLALRRDSQRLAVLALVGGYLTPLLVSTGRDAQIQLFSYLALLNVGLLWMALAKDWRSLPGSFLFTLAYAALWYTHFYSPAKLVPSIVFATVFFVEFALVPAIQARRHGVLRSDAIALTLLNAAWYLAALDAMLYESHRWGLTAGVLGVAAFYLVLANTTARKSDPGQPAARPIFGSVALTCVTVSIPIRLEGQWIAIAWAVEGAILVWNGLSADVRWLRTAGLLVLAAVVAYLIIEPIPADRPFLNGRFATFMFTALALGIAGWLGRRSAAVSSQGERLAYKVAEVGSNFFVLAGISPDAWQALKYPAQLFALSLIWATYAGLLAIVGLIGNHALSRYQAYVLFMLVIGKVVVFDASAQLTAAHPFANLRFLTCAVVAVALGSALLMSTRYTARLTEGEGPILRFFQVVFNAFAVWALSIETWQAFPPAGQQFALSLVWTLYAGVLIAVGIRRDSALVRWQALALFALVIFKVVAYDLSLLAMGYRIVSFFALGVILLGASFLYQRRLFGRQQEKT
jgi:uncharacterized membrane protein